MDRRYPLETCGGSPGRVVCRCLGVTEAQLLEALATGEVHGLRDVRRLTGAGEGCTCCHQLLRSYLERYAPVASGSSSALPICSVR
jgi:bacterioferritin-associated ferredoxin